MCEVFDRRSLTTSCAKGRETKRIHTAWAVEVTEERKVQRSIFSTRFFWQLRFTTRHPSLLEEGLCSTQRLSQSSKQKSRPCIFHTITAGYTHVNPHTKPCHRSSQADPTAYSQASVCPALGASHCRLPYWSQRLTTPIKWRYDAVISETQVGMNKWLTQHVKPQWCKTRVSSWQGHTLNQTHTKKKRKKKSALLPGNPLIWLQGTLWREHSIGHSDHKNYSIMCMFPKSLGCLQKKHCLGVQAFPLSIHTFKVEGSKR